MLDDPEKTTCVGGCCGRVTEEITNPSGESATGLADGAAPVAESGCCSNTIDKSEASSCCGNNAANESTNAALKDDCCIASEAEASCCSAKDMSSYDKTTQRDDCCAGNDTRLLAKPETIECAENVDNCCSPDSKDPPRNSRTRISGVMEKAAGNGSGMKKQCCSPASKKTSCCAGSSASTENAAMKDAGCCAASITKEPAPDVAKKDAIDGDCCVEVKAGCCDESCADRLADREHARKDSDCKMRKIRSDASSRTSQTDCCPNGVTTRQIYRSLLKSLGCLCKTAKARGEETCCVPDRRRASLERMKYAESISSSGRQTAFQQAGARAMRNRKAKCADKDHVHVITCFEDESGFCDATRKRTAPSAIDLEKGNPEMTHVILSVSGMTCFGCEKKLQRSLATVKSLKNLKTSLVLCRAEFDLDVRFESVENVIHQMERMTEFKYQEIKQEGAEIEVLPANAKDFTRRPLPTGVHTMELVDKQTVKISFDPAIIGARKLVEDAFDELLPLAPLKPDAGLSAGSKHVRHTGFMTLFSSVLTIPVLVLAWAPLEERDVLYGSISLVLATLVQFIVAGPFYPAALKALIFSRMIEMDLLIVISTSAAYVYSVVAFGYMVAGNPLSTGEFFETSTLLVTLIMVGRWVSALARHKAVEAVSIRSLQTPVAVIIDPVTLAQKEIDARLLQYGDLFRVAPEMRVPTDGTVTEGVSEIDESMMTGESLPVAKKPGSIVIAGSINGSGALTVRLSRLPGDNTISTIASMVDEAKLTKPKVQDIADKVAAFFVPTAIAMGLVCFLVWVPIGLRVRNYGGSEAVINALTYGITVIIVSCPCAIGLAVPMVIMIASGVAAKHGCIFKAATTIEIARKISHVVFDKTGTLTQGKLTVSKSKIYAENMETTADNIKAVAVSLLSNIKHPVALAVRAHLRAKGSSCSQETALNVTTLPGKGVQGNLGGNFVQAGNSRWLDLVDHPDVQDFLEQGYTTFCVTSNGHLAAIFGLEDDLREGTASTVAELQSRGIVVSIVSGDDEGPVAKVARQLNITTYKSRCTPADKQAYMQSINATSKATSIFCGDGTNDAVALAQATIGVHMNGGTDIAQSAADVILARSSIADILCLIDLSKATMRRIKFNFAWAFTYNTLAILLASGALVNARIPPEYAGLGELVSVLPVIAIAMQLRWAKFQKVKGADV